MARSKKWNQKILEVLSSGPLKTGDLIEKLGFSPEIFGFDMATRFSDCLRPLTGSFDESPAQKELDRMVSSGEVIWRRAANLDNWYGLPNSCWPKEACCRTRKLIDLVREIKGALPLNMQHSITEEEIGNIEVDDAWVQFDFPNVTVVLSEHEKGWILSDGDGYHYFWEPSFEKVYPMDVKAKTIARRIVKEEKQNEKGSLKNA